MALATLHKPLAHIPGEIKGSESPFSDLDRILTYPDFDSNILESEITDPEGVNAGVEIFRRGGALIAQFQGVDAIVVDPFKRLPENVDTFGYEYRGDLLIRAMKSSLSTSMSREDLILELASRGAVAWLMDFYRLTVEGYIDTSDIQSNAVRSILNNPEELTRCLGNLAFLRFKVNKSALQNNPVPPFMLSEDSEGNMWAQVFTFAGHSDAYNLQKRLQDAILTEYSGEKPPIIAITSANVHGSPEIVDRTKASQYWHIVQKYAPVILHGSSDFRIGSYPIIEVGDKFRLIRSGNLPLNLIQVLLPEGIELVVDGSNLRNPNYETNISTEVVEYLKSIQHAGLRNYALGLFTEGKSISQVRKLVKDLETSLFES
jgi:hypothetical protein